MRIENEPFVRENETERLFRVLLKQLEHARWNANSLFMTCHADNPDLHIYQQHATQIAELGTAVGSFCANIKKRTDEAARQRSRNRRNAE